MIDSIKKRDGRIVAFDLGKITAAIEKAFAATGIHREDPAALAAQVATRLQEAGLTQPEVEQIQDCVEQGTMTGENVDTRPMRNWIVCLPNGISIELRLASEETT